MFQHILVAIDGSHTSRSALDVALQLARDNHASLWPVYVICTGLVAYDLSTYDAAAMQASLFEEGRQVTEEASQLMVAAGVAGQAMVRITPPGGDVVQCLLNQADLVAADLLVLGTHGRRGIRRLMLGSVAEHVVRQSTRPVLLVPDAMLDAAHRTQVEADVAH